MLPPIDVGDNVSSYPWRHPQPSASFCYGAGCIRGKFARTGVLLAPKFRPSDMNGADAGLQLMAREQAALSNMITRMFSYPTTNLGPRFP